MNTAQDISNVPAEFAKNFLMFAAFLLSMGLNAFALYRSKREVSGMVKTQAVQDVALKSEVEQVDAKLDTSTAKLLEAGERRAEQIAKRMDEKFFHFESKLTELRAEIRNEFSDFSKIAFQRLNTQGERIAAIESKRPPR